MSSNYVLAKEIMSRMKAVVLADGIDENDPVVRQLFEEEKQLNNMNEEVIEKIIVDAGYEVTEIKSFWQFSTKIFKNIKKGTLKMWYYAYTNILRRCAYVTNVTFR